MHGMGKSLIFFGILLVIIGLVIEFSAKIGWPGRLPGDFVIEKKNVKIYIPLATSLVLSLLLTLIFMLIRWLKH